MVRSLRGSSLYHRCFFGVSCIQIYGLSQIVMETCQPTTDEHYLGLNLKFSPPILVGYHRLTGRYSIVPPKSQSLWTRTYGIVLNSVGVSVSLGLQSTQHRLFHRDIVACERSWLRWVQSKLATHQKAKNFGWIRESLVGQLSALVSQDRARANRQSAETHGLSLQLGSFHDISHNQSLSSLSI